MKSVIKVGIVGYGFVGKAVEYGFSKNTEIFKVDPLLNTSSVSYTHLTLPTICSV